MFANYINHFGVQLIFRQKPLKLHFQISLSLFKKICILSIKAFNGWGLTLGAVFLFSQTFLC